MSGAHARKFRAELDLAASFVDARYFTMDRAVGRPAAGQVTI